LKSLFNNEVKDVKKIFLPFLVLMCVFLIACSNNKTREKTASMQDSVVINQPVQPKTIVDTIWTTGTSASYRYYLNGHKIDVIIENVNPSSLWAEFNVAMDGLAYSLYDMHVGYHGPGKNQIADWKVGVENSFNESPEQNRPFNVFTKLLAKNDEAVQFEYSIELIDSLVNKSQESLKAYYHGFIDNYFLFKDEIGKDVKFKYDEPENYFLKMNEKTIHNELLTISYTMYNSYKTNRRIPREIKTIVSIWSPRLGINSIDWCNSPNSKSLIYKNLAGRYSNGERFITLKEINDKLFAKSSYFNDELELKIAKDDSYEISFKGKLDGSGFHYGSIEFGLNSYNNYYLTWYDLSDFDIIFVRE